MTAKPVLRSAENVFIVERSRNVVKSSACARPPMSSLKLPSAHSKLSLLAAPRQLDDDRRCLGYGDSAFARRELQLVHCFARHQRDDAMWPRLNFHVRHDAVLDDPRDQPGEAISCRLTDDLARCLREAAQESREDRTVDDALSSRRPACT
jgi:hypothetical protein